MEEGCERRRLDCKPEASAEVENPNDSTFTCKRFSQAEKSSFELQKKIVRIKLEQSGRLLDRAPDLADEAFEAEEDDGHVVLGLVDQALLHDGLHDLVQQQLHALIRVRRHEAADHLVVVQDVEDGLDDLLVREAVEYAVARHQHEVVVGRHLVFVDFWGRDNYIIHASVFRVLRLDVAESPRHLLVRAY